MGSVESFWMCPVLSRNSACITWRDMSRRQRTQSFFLVLEMVTVAVLSWGLFIVTRVSHFGGYKSQVGNLLKGHLLKPHPQKPEFSKLWMWSGNQLVSAFLGASGGDWETTL